MNGENQNPEEINENNIITDNPIEEANKICRKGNKNQEKKYRTNDDK